MVAALTAFRAVVFSAAIAIDVPLSAFVCLSSVHAAAG
jgi:hypothetical protein